MLSADELDSIDELLNPPVDEAAAKAHAKLVADAQKESDEFRKKNLPMAQTYRWPMTKVILERREDLPDQSAYPKIFRKLRKQLAS